MRPGINIIEIRKNLCLLPIIEIHDKLTLPFFFYLLVFT